MAAEEESDPLSFLVGPSNEKAPSPLFDDVARDAGGGTTDNNESSNLRQVRADKFGVKPSVIKEKARVQAVQRAASSSSASKDILSPVSQHERGLGFTTVPELSSDSAGKAQKEAVNEVDILATLAATENKYNETESSIFDSLGVSLDIENKEKVDSDTLFDKKTTVGETPRIGEKFGNR